ncbi:MAG: 6-bladed beta-propeller [candidate division KSB1 bacterium]|nr:6-bladed beta-propeller [candidate division KSB1 bacterium]MDZ7367474.1 6-bladed beta-propeller [candidate division KSB1 bacterium]
MNCDNFLVRAYNVLICLVLLFVACDRNKSSNPPIIPQTASFDGNDPMTVAKKGTFDELFKREEQITLAGDSLAPIFNFYRPLITTDKIFVCDYMAHTVSIYSKRGSLIKKFGKKGEGPGEFQMPYSFATDAQGNLYVNDRANMRVQVYDSSLRFLRMMPMVGQNEIILVRNTPEKPNIVSVGTAPCGDGNCLLQEYDWKGKLIKAFAGYKTRFILFSWAATQDGQNNIYLVNYLEQEIKVFDPNGELFRTVKLSSPSMRFLEAYDTEPKSMARLQAISKLLKEKEHTRVEELHVDKDHIFVFLRLIRKATDPMFILDIYNLEGNLLFYGIETPGRLCYAKDRFYFANDDETRQYGRVQIEGYQFMSNYKMIR